MADIQPNTGDTDWGNKVNAYRDVGHNKDGTHNQEDWLPIDYAGAASKESVTLPNGRIEKTGAVVDATASGTVTFDAAFPNGIVSVMLTTVGSVAHNEQYQVETQQVGSFTWLHIQIANITGFNWTAIGY